MQLTLDQYYDTIEMLGNLFQPCFGPRGLDKLLFDKFNDHLLVSNDGATILKDLTDVIEPRFALEMLKWGKAIDTEAGDGVKSFYILLGELLHRSRELIKSGIPSLQIIQSLQLQHKIWREFASEPQFVFPASQPLTADLCNNYLNPIFQGKFSPGNAEHIIRLVYQVIERLGTQSTRQDIRWEDRLQFEFMPGTLIKDSYLVEGVLIGKEPITESLIPPDGFKSARVLLIRQKLYFDVPTKQDKKEEGIQYEFAIKGDQNIEDYNQKYKNIIETWFQHILPLQPQIIITEKGVDRHFEALCNKNHIILVRRAKPEEFEYLRAFLGVEPVDDIQLILPVQIATVDRVIYKKIGRDTHLILSNDTQKANSTNLSGNHSSIGTIMIGGSLWMVCEEVTRFFKKALRTLIWLQQHRKFFYGGGNTELQLHQRIRVLADTLDDKRALVLHTLADGLLILPHILLTNCGLDSLPIISALRQQISTSKMDTGYNVTTSSVMSMQNAQLYDSYTAKKILYERVFETLQFILRIDKILPKIK